MKVALTAPAVSLLKHCSGFEDISIVILLMQVLILCLTLLPVQRGLKREFYMDGNRRHKNS